MLFNVLKNFAITCMVVFPANNVAHSLTQWLGITIDPALMVAGFALFGALVVADRLTETQHKNQGI